MDGSIPLTEMTSQNNHNHNHKKNKHRPADLEAQVRFNLKWNIIPFEI